MSKIAKHKFFNFSLLTIICISFFSFSSQAQVTLKPIIGYYQPKLDQVNSEVASAIKSFRDLTGSPLEIDDFSAKPIFGGELEYHLGDNYFAGVQLIYYNDEVISKFSSTEEASTELDFQRDIAYYDFKFIIRQFFNYNSWRRYNAFFGIAVGIVQVDANSLTYYKANNDVVINTDGEFSRTTLSAAATLGAELTIAKPLKIWVEGGYQVANASQLDGFVETLQTDGRVETISNAEFDLSGFFIRGGIGIRVPFLN